MTFKNLSTITLIICSCLLTSCGSSDQKTPKTTEAKTTKKAAVADKSFSNKNSQEGSLQNIGDHSYDIKLVLRDKDKGTNFNTSSSTPPMPFNIGGWAMMKKSSNNFFLYNSESKIGTNFELSSDWASIRILANKSKNQTAFYLNDKVVSVKPSFTNLKTFYSIGKGYQDRYWEGDFRALTIKDVNTGKFIYNLK